MPHPRRSRQFRSARARAFRAKDVNLPRLRYVAEGRTLLLVQTRAILDLEREERVERAALAYQHVEEDYREAYGAVIAAWGLHPTAIHSICRAVGLAECVHQLGLAEAELKAAKRSLARPAALPVTLAVVSPPEPRRWPNALLGGTSRRRAQAAEWRATWARWLAFDDGR